MPLVSESVMGVLRAAALRARIICQFVLRYRFSSDEVDGLDGRTLLEVRGLADWEVDLRRER